MKRVYFWWWRWTDGPALQELSGWCGSHTYCGVYFDNRLYNTCAISALVVVPKGLSNPPQPTMDPVFHQG